MSKVKKSENRAFNLKINKLQHKTGHEMNLALKT